MRDDDVAWVTEINKRRYPTRFDAEATALWIRNVVLRNPLVFCAIRNDHSYVIAHLAVIPWFPRSIECNTCIVCADIGHMWRVIPVLRSAVEWARRHRASAFRITSQTEFDLGPIAKRLNMTKSFPLYSLEV
jgi:hypothetical protein